MGGTDKVELRVELPSEAVAVIDGYCSATGKSRTDVLRDMLAKWSADRLHVATVICRVAGVNPMALDADRNPAR